MIIATCLGSPARFNFSSRNASSAVRAPSGWDAATCSVFEEIESVTEVEALSFTAQS
jgi:hypothetical protein